VLCSTVAGTESLCARSKIGFVAVRFRASGDGALQVQLDNPLARAYARFDLLPRSGHKAIL